MRQCLFHWFCVAAGLLLLGIPLSGQSGIASGNNKDQSKDKDANQASPANTSNARTHLPYVQDWSTRHLLRPGTRLEDVLASGNRDPRLIYNMLRHQAALKNSSASGIPLRPKEPKKTKIDWAVSLENGYMSPDEFPAKFSFDTDTEDCQSDYVLFTLNVNTMTGTFTQANLVGINNLYTELTPTPCNSRLPWVAFAYNTQTQPGGQIFTSPTLSADGAMVAFVESTTTASYFHVLVLPNPIPTPGAMPSNVGTVITGAAPTLCAKPNAQNCMTTLTISATDSISISSPWIDYASDTAYVGDDNGFLYKITPVFRGGAPKLVSDDNWPVTVSTSMIPLLTDPIVDTNSGLIFLGDLAGNLYSVPLASPGGVPSAAMQIGAEGRAGAGIVDPPIVVTDPANPAVDQVFAFTGCSSLSAVGGAVTQVPATFMTGDTTTTTNTVNLTVAARSGAAACTASPMPPFPGNVHSGTFDNNFWVNGSTSGHLIACGFNSGGGNAARPRMYMLPFVSGIISKSIASFAPDTTKGDECSPLTEFFDGATDRVFFGVGDTYTSDPTADGFVESATIEATSFLTGTHDCTGTPTSTCVTAPPALGGVSGIVIDNLVTDGGTNIYFSTLAPGSVQNGNCSVLGGLANPYCAVKLTQVDFTQP